MIDADRGSGQIRDGVSKGGTAMTAALWVIAVMLAVLLAPAILYLLLTRK